MDAPRATPLERGRALALFGRIQQCWLALIFFVGLAYILLVPPFQAVDEVAHWDRVWSVARGDYTCREIPLASGKFVDLAYRFDSDWSHPPTPIRLADVRELWDFVGPEGRYWIATNGCHYPPVGYLPAALAVRLFTPGAIDEPRAHKPFIAHYGARLTHWILFFGCAVYAFRKSRFAAPVMVFLSIPLVLHQAMSINNDAVVLGGALVAFALLTQEPSRRRIWTAIVIIALLSAIKPIHAAAATLVWAALREAHRNRVMLRKEIVLASLASLALPVGAWLTWHATMTVPILGLNTGMPVGGVDEATQIALLKAEPTRILSVMWWQLKQVFDTSPINGSWRGVLLVLGWYRHMPPEHVYPLSLAALALGLVALRGDVAADRRAIPALYRATIYGSIAAYSVVVVLVLYTAFTPVGAELVFGVQGRYFFFPILLLLFVWSLQPPRFLKLGPITARVLACAALAVGLSAHAAALLALRDLYWAH